SQGWFEWRVTWTDDRFAWTRSAELETTLVAELNENGWCNLPASLRALLPDGFTVELCPAARTWWSQAAGALRAGKLLTFDYGLEAEEFLAPHRQHGTLRGYRAHRLTSDPLAEPGTQDLTAHVNFSSLMRAGEAASLRTDFFRPQSSFLTGIVARI